MTVLSVNIDHVATLREARGVSYPDPVAAARIALAAGADGITVHLRQDRRHIQDQDIERLRDEVDTKLNLEMAATDEMLAIAVTTSPSQVTLVPERPEEVTTEGGLDLLAHGKRVSEVATRLTEAGIEVSVFLDPEADQIRELDQSGSITGFEINTDAYSQSAPTTSQITQIREAAALGVELGFRVYAGHGLTTQNVGPVAVIREIEELNIGHSIVSRAVLVGMHAAVEEMLDAMGSR